MTKHRRPRRWWTAAEILRLTREYADTKTTLLAVRWRRPTYTVYSKAYDLGLKKSARYLASPDACRLRRGDNVGARYRFPPGHVPANKGLRRPGWAPGRMAETQFKKGQKSHNWMPLGSTRYSKEGYVQRKMTDTGYPPRDWKGVHILLWEERHGPVQPGYALKFIDGNKRHVVLDNLALVSRQDLMGLNTLHRYPKELVRVIQLRGALIRQINRRTRHEKHIA